MPHPVITTMPNDCLCICTFVVGRQGTNNRGFSLFSLLTSLSTVSDEIKSNRISTRKVFKTLTRGHFVSATESRKMEEFGLKEPIRYRKGQQHSLVNA